MGFGEAIIEFVGGNDICIAGQVAQGKLIYVEDKVTTYQSIYINVKGYCDVHWDFPVPHGTRIHYASEVYFQHKIYLVGGESGEQRVDAGKHEFPFRFQIPSKCPSSYEGTYGHIRYEFKAIAVRNNRKDEEKSAFISLVAPYDLNGVPDLKKPITFEMIDSYNCCCVSLGSSQTIVKLPVRGYCPGQVIPVEISCTNNSSVEIRAVEFSIIRHTKFQACQETRHESDEIAKIRTGAVAGKTTYNGTVDFEVPDDVEPYNMEYCNYIDIDYEFKVTIEPRGCHDNREESTAIIIGTNPFVGFQDFVRKPQQDYVLEQPQSILGVPSTSASVSLPSAASSDMDEKTPLLMRA